MSAEQINQLWTIVRENERDIAVLSSKLGATSEEVKRLRESNEAIKAIIDRAIGAKTFAGVVGGIVGAAFGWGVAIMCAKIGGQ